VMLATPPVKFVNAMIVSPYVKLLTTLQSIRLLTRLRLELS